MESYIEWQFKIHKLRKIELQRFVLRTEQADTLFLHLFCDASEIRYAACNFIVAQDEPGGWNSTLLTAKAKIAPLKTQSIPRLELCADLLGCQLDNSALESLNKMNVKIQSQYAWTDFAIVLNWLSSEPSVWATLVANRVAKLQENKNLFWVHVQTHENPAQRIQPPEGWFHPSLRICQSGGLVQIGSKLMDHSFHSNQMGRKKE